VPSRASKTEFATMFMQSTSSQTNLGVTLCMCASCVVQCKRCPVCLHEGDGVSSGLCAGLQCILMGSSKGYLQMHSTTGRLLHRQLLHNGSILQVSHEHCECELAHGSTAACKLYGPHVIVPPPRQSIDCAAANVACL
jgi:hypothetical protein